MYVRSLQLIPPSCGRAGQNQCEVQLLSQRRRDTKRQHSFRAMKKKSWRKGLMSRNRDSCEQLAQHAFRKMAERRRRCQPPAPLELGLCDTDESFDEIKRVVVGAHQRSQPLRLCQRLPDLAWAPQMRHRFRGWRWRDI